MMSNNQFAKRKRKQSIKDLKCDKKSTNDFKESLEPSWSFINVFLDDGRKRLTRGMLRKLNEQNVIGLTNRESFLSNSVIVLNDNVEQVMTENEETNNRDDQDVSIIECSYKSALSLQQMSQKEKLQNVFNKKKNRSSIILMNNDLSDDHSANIFESSVHESIQSSSNGENIAPQREDDIVELWSSLKTNKRNKNTFKKHEYNENKEKCLCFVIDTKPNLKNLDYLKINTDPVNKKQKLHHKINKSTLAHNPFVMQVTSKDFKQGQKTKQHNNNIQYSNIKSTKAQFLKTEKKEKQKCPALNKVSNSTSNSTSTSNPSSNKLREIIVDGSNVAREYTHHKGFAEKGIQLVVDYFMSRGHDVKVFLPQHVRRKKYSFLEQMYEKGIVVFTPSRKVLGRQITPYDDRYILEYATLCDGIVISADQYRDLYKEKPEWRDTIVNRLLTPTFVGDCVMFPEDPLGRFGPNLNTFLQH